MDRSGAQSQLSTRRQPLGDATSRINIEARSPKRQVQKPLPSSSPRSIRSNNSNGLPHHESLMGHGRTQAPTTPRHTSSPEDKRVVAIAEESESKRDSQNSTNSNASGQRKARKSHVGPWRLGNTIGQGMCGNVRKTRHSVTGQDAAVKVIAKKTAEKSHAQSLQDLIQSTRNERPSDPKAYLIPFGLEREIVIMKLLKHKNVVELYDVWENRNEIYLVMEYVDGGELFQYIYDAKYLLEDEAVWIFRQIVAALLHCHRLGITHRDLKPENILLTHRYNPETGSYSEPVVKVADFGMAALQPTGKKLTTPCGSMHYAAPEVFDRYYDGGKIDVWSLGVILYVMLVGAVPFAWKENEHWSVVQKIIKRGTIYMPEGDATSLEAEDLVRKMLTPDPRRRIALEAAWKHPLFRKWSHAWGETEAERSLENWIGETPEIGNWSIWTPSNIDREILRNLRALWHREKEDVLVQRLISEEANMEKLFYVALQRHTEEQLENYSGPDGVQYSGSDYHHIKPVLQPFEIPPIPPSAYTRNKSQFSIMSDNASPSYSRSTLQHPPPSENSYDPFRASLNPIVTGKDQFNVTVHRGASQYQKQSGSQNSQRPDSLRVHTLRAQGRLPTTSSVNSIPKMSTSPRPGTAHSKRSASRNSLTSSLYRSSPPVATHAKTSILHRPGVNFSHLRRSSSASAIASPGKSGKGVTSPGKPSNASGSTTEAPESTDPPSSPLVAAKNRPASRKEVNSNGRQAPRKSRTEGNIVDSETRKVSSELEKACDEAFFRSSVGSSHASSSKSHGQHPYETPPSSVSRRASAQSHSHTSDGKRPLPEPPAQDETPNTFLSRELLELRKKLEERYPEDKATKNAYSEVQALLDSYTQSSAGATEMFWSAPRGRSPVPSGPLPMISEEGKNVESEELEKAAALLSHPARRMDDKRKRPKSSHLAPTDPETTIRMIEPLSPPPRIAPLNIRKVSNSSSASGEATSNAQTDGRYYRGPAAPVQKLSRKASLPTTSPSHAITGDEGTYGQEGQISLPGIIPKKRGWFKRTFGADTNTIKEGFEPESQHLREGLVSPPKRKGHLEQGEEPTSPLSSPKPLVQGKRPGFLSFLARKRPTQGDNRMVLGDADSAISGDSNGRSNRNNAGVYKHRGNGSLLSPGEDSQRTDSRDLGVQRSWLTRFLHIKPASKILCFDTGRGRVRTELVRLLRNWRLYGLRDVVLDREKNLIFGRLASENYLRIKEVAFVIELFVVLEHGLHANLCIARFTQRKGAASSFRKLVDTIDNLMAGRRMLVEDIQRRRDMEGILLG